MRYVIILFILLICCSGSNSEKIDHINEPHYKVYADMAFTISHKIGIATALAEWNAKTDNLAQYDLEFIPSAKMRGNEPSTIYIYSKEMPPEVLGNASWSRKTQSTIIKIYSGMTDNELFTAVIMHEVGHAMGLLHYEGGDLSVMHPAMGNTSHVECRDLKTFCDLWNCTIDCDPKLTYLHELNVEPIKDSDINQCILSF